MYDNSDNFTVMRRPQTDLGVWVEFVLRTRDQVNELVAWHDPLHSRIPESPSCPGCPGFGGQGCGSTQSTPLVYPTLSEMARGR